MNCTITPYSSTSLDHYSRLFPPLDPPSADEAMIELGLSMRNDLAANPDETRIPFGARTITLPAGFTYFGQFVDHDITRDDTDLDDASDDLGAVVNGGGGRLDLNHLYGDGPGSDKDGQLFADDGASFRLGEARLPNGVQFDLPLNDRGEPEAADDRSAENFILRQICAIFMKLHNQAVRELPATTRPAERFARAHQRVCWQYQWIIRHEFLAQICTAQVYRQLFGDGYEAKPLTIDWSTGGFSIPVEFSHAAFRFGHSMVRPSYRLNSRSPEVTLQSLLNHPVKTGSIPISQAVDWQTFFENGPGAENAMAIDTVVASPLFDLSAAHLHHVVIANPPPLPPELPVRTLLRGARIRLPAGESVAEKFGRGPLRGPIPKGYEKDPWSDLDRLGLTGRTPLWYYILLEAELEQQGGKLGTLGSQLVAEVIEGSLRADPESFLTVNGPTWRPPAWTSVDGSSIQVTRLIDVARVVGLTTSPTSEA
jgi:hypothetical protein